MNKKLTFGTAIALLSLSSGNSFSQQVGAQSPTPSVREVPARTLPVPETVSPQMQAVIARPPNPAFNATPQTTDEWKTRVDQAARTVASGLPKLREALGVTVEPTSFAGVKAFIVTPKSIPDNNRQYILLHLHGGVRVLNPGEAGTREAILMASFAGFKVISVDYRMPPDDPFPAALDDAVTVYREILKTTPPENVGQRRSSNHIVSDAGELHDPRRYRPLRVQQGVPLFHYLMIADFDRTDLGNTI